MGLSLASQDLSNLIAQDRTPILGRAPHHFPIDTEISVHKDIAERDDLRPRDVRILRSNLIRDPACGFADHRQFVDHSATQQFRLLESLEIDIPNELSDVISGFYNVGEIERLMPHKAAERL